MLSLHHSVPNCCPFFGVQETLSTQPTTRINTLGAADRATVIPCARPSNPVHPASDPILGSGADS